VEFVIAIVAVGAFLACVLQALFFSKAQTEIASKHDATLLALAESNRNERRELLNRIQHPERMPTRTEHAGEVRASVSPETRHALSQVGRAAPQQVTDGDT
jgi:hypothetical protein